jgi:uncharacterized protein with HEPN domain
VQKDVHGKRERLTRNRTVRDAVLRNLQIPAESTQRLSKSAKAARPDIPWKQIGGFRNRLVHDYFQIDLDVVWQIIEKSPPGLKIAAREMLEELGKP